MPYAEIGGKRLFYALSQSRQAGAPALVLIHGAGGSHLHWPSQLRRLEGATVYALDLPGHGRSDGPGHDDVPDYVTAVIRFLDAVQVEQAVLIGHSMGGAIAQMSGLTYPGRAAGLVLVGTGARLRVAPAILEGIRDNPEAAFDLITRYAWAPGAPEDLVQLGRETLAEIPPEVLYGDYAACDRFDVMDRLDEIRVPVLVIAGTADRLTPHKYGVYLVDQLPDARLVTIEGGGHMMMLEQPNKVAEAVAEFLRKRLG
jgi:pimeloyl-ACP methyl ester carboxylesterase